MCSFSEMVKRIINLKRSCLFWLQKSDCTKAWPACFDMFASLQPSDFLRSVCLHCREISSDVSLQMYTSWPLMVDSIFLLPACFPPGISDGCKIIDLIEKFLCRHAQYTELFTLWCNTGIVIGSVWAFSSLLNKELSWRLASSPDYSQILSQRRLEKSILHVYRINLGGTNYAPDEVIMKKFRHCLKTSLQNETLTNNGLKNFSGYVNLCTKIGHNFGCHMNFMWVLTH